MWFCRQIGWPLWAELAHLGEPGGLRWPHPQLPSQPRRLQCLRGPDLSPYSFSACRKVAPSSPHGAFSTQGRQIQVIDPAKPLLACMTFADVPIAKANHRFSTLMEEFWNTALWHLASVLEFNYEPRGQGRVLSSARIGTLGGRGWSCFTARWLWRFYG